MNNSNIITLKNLVKGIYTSNQCVDISDCEIALTQLKDIRATYPKYYKSLSTRIYAIEKKMQTLKNKSL